MIRTAITAALLLPLTVSAHLTAEDIAIIEQMQRDVHRLKQQQRHTEDAIVLFSKAIGKLQAETKFLTDRAWKEIEGHKENLR